MTRNRLTSFIVHLALALALSLGPQSLRIAQADERLDKAQVEIDQARRDLVTLTAQVKDNAEDDLKLVDLKIKADDLGKRLLTVSASLRPRMDEIRKRLTDLGTPPAAGQPPEEQTVTDERNSLTAEKAAINKIVGDAESLSIEVTKQANEVTRLRRSLFAATLLGNTELSATVLSDAIAAIGTEFGNLSRDITSWLAFVWKFKRFAFLGAVSVSLVAALLFFALANRFAGAFLRREKDDEASYFARLSYAFWSTVLPSLTLGAFLVSSIFFLRNFNVLRPDIEPILLAFSAFVGSIFFIWRLSQAVFSPFAPGWRLVSLSNGGARSLWLAVMAMTVVNATDYLFGAISEVLGSPVVLTVAKSFLASLIVGLIVFAVSFLRPVLAASGEPEDRGGPWPHYLALALRFAGAALIFAAVTGYVGLASFIARQIVMTGAVLVTMYIGLLSGKAVARQNSFAGTRIGRTLGKRFQLSAVTLDQTGLAAGLGIYLLVLFAGVPLILLSWGFQLRDLEMWAVKLFTDITIGKIRISLVGIAGGILLFALGLFATRWFQRWLDGNVMARSHVDIGVRNSVKTGVGYLGIAVAAMIAISAAGIDLSSFALVAGALSLGIGFGLQNIVSNFVSGLILLVERPFKVGDWVVTGSTEGFVKRISVRATEIETFQLQSIIVPNSDLINAAVGNWTHRNRLGRIEIPVGVAYDSDPRLVMDILLELAKSHPLVLRHPEPMVAFLRFGDHSLDFEIRAYLADVLTGTIVRNDLRVAIFDRLKAEGIRIPFPRRELLVRMDGEGLLPTEQELFSGEALRKKAGKKAQGSEGDVAKPAE